MRNAIGTLLLLLLAPACKSTKPPAAHAATLSSRADDNAARTIVTPAGKEWPQPGGDYAGSSYDPDLNLIYYGTANPGVWNPDMRPGDNKWSITIFARNPDNGEAQP